MHFILQATYMHVFLPKGNKLGRDYLLTHCLKEKKTLNISIADDENNARNKGVYVYINYKSNASVYHFTNLIFGTNIGYK